MKISEIRGVRVKKKKKLRSNLSEFSARSAVSHRRARGTNGMAMKELRNSLLAENFCKRLNGFLNSRVIDRVVGYQTNPARARPVDQHFMV